MSELLTPEEISLISAKSIILKKNAKEEFCKAQLAKTDAEWEVKIKAERERIIKEIEKYHRYDSDDLIQIGINNWQSLKQQIREGLNSKK